MSIKKSSMAQQLGQLGELTLILGVMTLALGSWLRQIHVKVGVESETQESHSHSQECERMWRNEPTHSQVDSHFGGWSPYKVLDFQRVISRAKIHWIEEFIISLESSWNLNV
jgi:hypothetical protein